MKATKTVQGPIPVSLTEEQAVDVVGNMRGLAHCCSCYGECGVDSLLHQLHERGYKIEEDK